MGLRRKTVTKFTYDESVLENIEEENLAVLWYDEENNWYQILDQESVVDTENNTVSYTTTHFSTYMLVDSHGIMHGEKILTIETVVRERKTHIILILLS